jgi:hypothetical protein
MRMAGSVSASAMPTASSPQPSAMWMHASLPRNASSMTAGEVSVPGTSSTDASERSPGTLAGSRARMVTSCPSPASRLTTWHPMKLVPPVTMIFIYAAASRTTA